MILSTVLDDRNVQGLAFSNDIHLISRNTDNVSEIEFPDGS